MIPITHDKWVHFALVIVGLIVGGAVKDGCQWLSKKIWKGVLHKVEMTTEDLKAFREWKKNRAQ